jgi:iron(III) transport system substrate-binding protein
MLFMHFRITVRALVVIAALSLCVEPRTNALGAQADRQNDWDTTLRAAESEGQLTIYGCCYDYDRILEGFKKKFHKIKVATVAQPGGQLSSKILAERRGEKYLPDVVGAGANTLHDALYTARALAPLKPALILPEVLDQTKWHEREHRYIDPERQYIFAFVANSQSGQVSYNVDVVNPAEFKSYWDLLAPKWKGKMVSLDPTSFGMGAALQFLYYNPELGAAFIRRLYGEMQPALSRDARQMTDWLASGKYALCIRCTAGGEVTKAKRQGLRIEYLDSDSWKEGGSSSAAGGTLGLMSRAPHPNAAKLFINWFLSREGQIAMQKFGRPDAHNSRRIDIPKDDVDPYNRLEPGKKYFDLAKPEFQDLAPILKLVKEVLQTK